MLVYSTYNLFNFVYDIVNFLLSLQVCLCLITGGTTSWNIFAVILFTVYCQCLCYTICVNTGNSTNIHKQHHKKLKTLIKVLIKSIKS